MHFTFQTFVTGELLPAGPFAEPRLETSRSSEALISESALKRCLIEE